MSRVAHMPVCAHSPADLGKKLSALVYAGEPFMLWLGVGQVSIQKGPGLHSSTASLFPAGSLYKATERVQVQLNFPARFAQTHLSEGTLTR